MDATIKARGEGYGRNSPSQMALAAIRFVLMVVVSLSFADAARATTYYVNAANTAPVPPYTTWLTAATNIQDAIAMTVNGDTVLVTNGVYAYGSAVIAGNTNRFAVTNAITVESVNGPWVTEILGGGITNGSPKVRCAWLTNGVSLLGFTLMGGNAVNGTLAGGGVWCASSNAYVENCVIVSNIASQFGAGVYQGTFGGDIALHWRGHYQWCFGH